MKITGPSNYTIIILPPTKKDEVPTEFKIISPEGDGKIHGRAGEGDRPKLYIISHNKKPIYVGITRQSIRNRLRMGFKATGKGGYHGYKWRRTLKKVEMTLWYDEKGKASDDIEAIEAELVFNIRKHHKQWPEFQTEIHFHQSSKKHMEIAEMIFKGSL